MTLRVFTKDENVFSSVYYFQSHFPCCQPHNLIETWVMQSREYLLKFTYMFMGAYTLYDHRQRCGRA